ncbi:hypothetical protein HUN92_13270 [Bacillus firmus]|uniref:hypothetical protein n=1 Tax=Cytobacillus firmus TaxID=1399 RepID=UPI0015812693|nr:hypothetical protein [Cytobacillus firmus]MBG9550464.1 hypothetical protein [Cytobacillus firmus]MBG9602473.1 hypothetical protein [Cytobacillus firmus]MBG9657426.1 hypothetical protein [Cytobacillus firmus]MDD9312393.1 hypothetical protein [Cytobacillus firmus]MED1905246.1 hypothetical protein [Cytobacillus firmus]
MNSATEKYHQDIFQVELTKLKEKDYISSEHYEITMKAHHQYYQDLEELKREHIKAAKVALEISQKPIQQAKKTEKKKLSQEEIRERNISWLLNIGVILLLIGGLFVATSNWATMSNFMKSASIAVVSLLFYGFAFISGKVLKIERTSFAFIVLGSLFLPIFILSIGWFELLGPYLSYYGEGRYILGAAGSLLIFPVYSIFAQKLDSRLFVWFAYIALTACAGYTLAAFSLENDSFYLGLMLFNALLSAVFHRMKKHSSLKLFTREMICFAQINLLISTLLMLVFFNSHVFYSVNILLTAAVYLSMVYVTGRKEFHFVFSLLVVYGAYQLIENSMLNAAGPVFFALVGIGFLFVPLVMDKQYYWEKIFRMTSAAVSILAFLYISVEGILLMAGEPSASLLLAYTILAVQFIYLANVMANGLFAYLAPVFLAAALFQAVLMLDKAASFSNLSLPVFSIGFMLFISFGYLLKYPFLKVVESSSRDVAVSIMFFSVVIAAGLLDWLAAGTMLLIFSFVLYLMNKAENRIFYKEAIPWAIPLSIGFAFMFYGEHQRSYSSFYQNELGMAMNTILASIPLLILYGILSKRGHKNQARNVFLISLGFYTISLFTAAALTINEVWMRPAVFIGGIIMYLALYRLHKQSWISYASASISLLAYFMILIGLPFNLTIFNWVQFPLGAWILLGAAFYISKKDFVLARGFSWIGHIYMPFAMILTFFIYRENSIWPFMVTLAVYWISFRVSAKEWKVKIFLYSSFITLFMVILTGMEQIWEGSYSEYAILAVSCAVFIFWMTVRTQDKQRSVYFLIPWSVIGILAFLASYPFGVLPFIVSIIYTAGLILYMHKTRLDILGAIPLFLLYAAVLKFLFINGIAPDMKIVISAGFGLAAVFIGKMVYAKIFMGKKADSYTIVSLLFLFTAYLLPSVSLWAEVLPGLLMSAFLFLQRGRVASQYFRLPGLLAGAALLEPYYSLIRNIEIPDLFIREAYVLPLIILIIFFRKVLKGQYSKLTSKIQWGVLVAVSLLLVQDALASNTVYDALIVGTLSLISMLAGTFWRIKSYFFVGSGVLLLNVLLQTRPYWGNLPWWAYLLIAGSILISAASYNEWQKQKTADSKEPLLSKWKNNIINRLKEWS